jgi:hypothetical protein
VPKALKTHVHISVIYFTSEGTQHYKGRSIVHVLSAQDRSVIHVVRGLVLYVTTRPKMKHEGASSGLGAMHELHVR